MRKKGKNILVTGGCGFIGSHTVVELIENGYEVLIIDDLSNSDVTVIDKIEKITGFSPSFINCDLKNKKQLFSIFQSYRDLNAIIHFAAYKAVGESVQNPLKYYQNNLEGLMNILEATRKFSIQNFIFSSSATVYGIPDRVPISENSPTKRPFSAYGNTKKIGEEIIEDLVNSSEFFRAISLRYFNPIGAHDSGLIGEKPNGIPNNLLPYITQTAAGIRQELSVFGNDYNTKDGTPIRDYIHVVDLAQAHVKALERISTTTNKEKFEIFNLGTGNGYSVLEIIKAFEAVSEVKLNYKITDRRAGDVSELLTNPKKAMELLGWSARRDLFNMIRSAWEFESMNN